VTGQELAQLIESRLMPTGTEAAYQAAIAALLDERGIAYERERELVLPADVPRYDPFPPTIIHSLEGEGFVRTERQVPRAENRRDRPDFIVGRIAVEVKIGGSPHELLRQLARYSQHDVFDELVAVVSRVGLTRLPKTLNRKPLHVALHMGGIL
jgi:hypothetical protein